MSDKKKVSQFVLPWLLKVKSGQMDEEKIRPLLLNLLETELQSLNLILILFHDFENLS